MQALIVYLRNARSIKNKILKLQNFLQVNKVNIIMRINETKLDLIYTNCFPLRLLFYSDGELAILVVSPYHLLCLYMKYKLSAYNSLFITSR